MWFEQNPPTLPLKILGYLSLNVLIKIFLFEKKMIIIKERKRKLTAFEPNAVFRHSHPLQQPRQSSKRTLQKLWEVKSQCFKLLFWDHKIFCRRKILFGLQFVKANSHQISNMQPEGGLHVWPRLSSIDDFFFVLCYKRLNDNTLRKDRFKNKFRTLAGVKFTMSMKHCMAKWQIE